MPIVFNYCSLRLLQQACLNLGVQSIFACIYRYVRYLNKELLFNRILFTQGVSCSVLDQNPDWIRIHSDRGSLSGSGFLIRISEGKNDPQK